MIVNFITHETINNDITMTVIVLVVYAGLCKISYTSDNILVFWWCYLFKCKLILMRYGALTAVLMKTKVFWDINAVYIDKSINIYQFTRGHLRESKCCAFKMFSMKFPTIYRLLLSFTAQNFCTVNCTTDCTPERSRNYSSFSSLLTCII
jgi:hypothetical protein